MNKPKSPENRGSSLIGKIAAPVVALAMAITGCNKEPQPVTIQSINGERVILHDPQANTLLQEFHNRLLRLASEKGCRAIVSADIEPLLEVKRTAFGLADLREETEKAYITCEKGTPTITIYPDPGSCYEDRCDMAVAETTTYQPQ